MRRIINHLSQLQELTLIRNEHRAMGDGAHLGRLNESIDILTEKLPAHTRSIYQRLVKKDCIVLAPVNEGSCSVCGMRLPISQVQAVALAKELQSCPNCARIMYISEGARWTGEHPKRSAPRKVGIARFSAKSLMIPALESDSKDAAIRELAVKMASEGFVDDADKLCDTALDREAILSTAVDFGIAFPHARGVEGGGLTLALGISREGIPFDGKDGERSRLIFFFAIPTAVSAFYLKLLAGLTETFMKEIARQTLLDAESPEALWKALTRATRYTVK